jgi:hypothetical protein
MGLVAIATKGTIPEVFVDLFEPSVPSTPTTNGGHLVRLEEKLLVSII